MKQLPDNIHGLEIKTIKDTTALLVFITKEEGESALNKYISEPFGVLEISGIFGKIILKSENITEISLSLIDDMLSNEMYKSRIRNSLIRNPFTNESLNIKSMENSSAPIAVQPDNRYLPRLERYFEQEQAQEYLGGPIRTAN